MGLLALMASALAPAAARAQDQTKRLLLYTGTTGYRHSDAINQGRPIVQSKLEAAGYTVDWEDCTNNGGGASNCDNADKNPRIFTDDNLARYDAIVLLNASAGPPGPLWTDAQKASIIKYVQNGGGIAGVHNATDMGTGAETWDWWDGNNANSAVGTTMKGHAATDLNNIATVQVEDRNHLATRDLPDTWTLGDEHYNYRRNVRGDHHVLANLDERTYTPGGNAMGQDHPITWCRLYDGDNINDNTGTPKSYSDGRVWVTGMGHFGSSYTKDSGNNELVKEIVGGVRWVAGEGRKSDCSGTVWSSFTRTVVVADANNPIGVDVAKDGKVYWSEIGNPIGYQSTGYVKMYDPNKPAGNKTTVLSIPTRADHGNSEDGVLGMSLQPGFDLSDPSKRNVFVYYSPRNPDWPTSGNQQVVGYNQISRWTLTEDGTAAVPDSERVILRVPKAKISGTPSGFPGGPTNSGPGHVGGAGLDFDSAGNLYLGIGDDVSPGASGHNNYTPMDYRAAERWDARKTAQNSADLRGKIIRITPKQGAIAADADPGVGATYEIPDGNLFPVGTAKTRPEIYAMGFRQPFTVHTDPKNPGIIGMGEYCHDNSSDGANRSPAGTCEWNLIQKPGNFGWPFCVGNDSTANTSFRWNYASNSTTGQQYDCSLTSLPSDIRWAPSGQTAAEPTFDGLDTLPGPVVPATIWKKYSGADVQRTIDFGDLNAGGMQPITGPIYRYDEANAGQGAFPRYYDGSWFINNRGANEGFWKEVRMRSDNNQMLRVNDWLPYNGGVNPNGADSGLVIGTQFGPDGNLYMSRFSVGCCRDGTNANQKNQIIKISFNVQDECLTDENAPNAAHEATGQVYPGEDNTFVNAASLRLSATDSGCAGVKSIEYKVNGEADWHTYETPIAFNTAGNYSVQYRATDRKDNVSAVKTATFKVLEIHDETPPTATASTSGSADQRGYFAGSASLSITATDDELGSGVNTIEYRINGGAYTPYTAPVAFNSAGEYKVDYRATDKVNNTSDPKTITFRVITGAGCKANRSDEFDGTTLGSQWLRHTRNNGTPLSAITFSDGQLHMPTADYELDAAAAATSLGPVNFIGQDLNALGSNWSVETEFTVKYTGGWQNTGLIVWNGDNNFFRSSITHSLSAGNIYIESSKDNPTTAEGERAQANGNITILPNHDQPVTIRMRYSRTNGANTVRAQYRVMAPASVAMADWADFPNTTSGFLDLNPSGGARRDAAGSRIGILTGSNFPGTSGTYAYKGTPGTVDVNYFRVTPDSMTCETDAPTTTATLDPAAPATGDTYDRSVKVNLSAVDAGGAGVEKTEYRINTNGTDGEWKTLSNTAGDATFANTVTVSNSGTHVVEFRSTDKAANVETTKSVTFKVQLPVCDRSDEFDGTEILPRWIRHTRNGGTPTTGPLAPTVSGGQLHLPTNDLEIDAADSNTSVGPINFLGQDLPSLGSNWQVETQFTVQFKGGWQNVGLVVWQGDNNFFRSTITHNLQSSAIFVESSKDAPSTTEGARTSGTNRAILTSNTGPVTIKMRYTRSNGANTVTPEYQIVAPASAATSGWVAFPSINGNLDLNPSGTRRDATGSRIGLIAQDNWPAGGPYPSNGQPAIAHVDYFRVTPDNCPTGADQTPPTTTATTAPAAPNGSNGWFTSDVNVTLAGNDGANGSGIDTTEYRVDGGTFAAYTAPFAVSTAGTHTIEYRSTDKAGNVEATKTLTVKVDKVAPATTATLDPTGSGGVYDGPVTLTLAATDATSGVARSEYLVNAPGAFAAFGAAAPLAAAAAADYVTYDSANKPKFEAGGSYSIDFRSIDAAGNVETAKTITFSIVLPSNDKTAPVTTATLDPATPGAGRTYSGPVTVKFSATDPAPAGPAAKTVDVEASGDAWAPNAVDLAVGDSIRWSFPEATANFPHDVWVIAPGQPATSAVEAAPITLPGGAPSTRQFNEAGTWTFVCKIHAFISNGVYTGMVGKAVVTPAQAGDAPSGVDYTEYRVKTGDTQGDWSRAANTGSADPFASQVTVSADGQHTVEYRSVDKAGNTEATKSVSFGIQTPAPGNPVIQAFADPTSGVAPLPVNFTATGYDPDGSTLTWKWQFEDGAYLGRTVSRTFTKPGVYTATVTATDAQGEKTSQEVTVTVTRAGEQPPTVEVSASATTVQGGSSVQFTAVGHDPDGPDDDLGYVWDFGDNGSSHEQNPSHRYVAPGTYTAKVTVTDATGASVTKSIEITVTAPPANQPPIITEAAGFPLTGSAPLTVQFSIEAADPNGDAVSYEWDFGDGSAKATSKNPTHTYTQTGEFTATVKVTDSHGDSTTANVLVKVSPRSNQAPTVDAAADPVSGTSPLTVSFSGTVRDPDGDGMSIVWDFGDGLFGAGPNTTHTYTAPGVYTATLTATDSRGASTSKSVTITVTAAQGANNGGGNGGGSNVTGADTKAPAAAPVAPWFGVAQPATTALKTFSAKGLRVTLTSTTATRGTAKLTVSKKVAKKLGLKKTTLASRTVKFSSAGSTSVTLKPSAAVRRALRKAKGKVKATLTVSLRATGKSAKATKRTVTLR
ncbi:MAG TPA: PKD domain-containing protein [Solirubrobacter sp.]|nr:PKD domain-containing protein [Solirubrobacter sp.]